MAVDSQQGRQYLSVKYVSFSDGRVRREDQAYRASILHDILNIIGSVNGLIRVSALCGDFLKPWDLERKALTVGDVPVESAHLD